MTVTGFPDLSMHRTRCFHATLPRSAPPHLRHLRQMRSEARPHPRLSRPKHPASPCHEAEASEDKMVGTFVNRSIEYDVRGARIVRLSRFSRSVQTCRRRFSTTRCRSSRPPYREKLLVTQRTLLTEVTRIARMLPRTAGCTL